jgi:putative CocE/NonD family hydrolase
VRLARLLFLAPIVALFGAAIPGAAQEQVSGYSQLFDKTEVMIPARDGVKLHTEIYVPKNITEPLPILFERTPYGISDKVTGFSRKLGRYADLMPDGYIFVFQDIRGRYGSEGKFVMQRPLHDPSDPQGIDESTDTYDTIDWLVKNVPHNNGRVGMDGISYPGFLVTMGMINPHPALKAVSEQACMGDVFLGDEIGRASCRERV